MLNVIAIIFGMPQQTNDHTLELPPLYGNPFPAALAISFCQGENGVDI